MPSTGDADDAGDNGRKQLRVLIAAILVLTASGPAAAEWKYTETSDPMTDQKYARTFADGDNGSIGVKCDAPGGADSLYLHFISKDYLGGYGAGSAPRDLMVRFDDEPPETMTWRYDGHSAILVKRKDVWPFISRLEKAHKLAVRTLSYDYKQVTTVIDVSDAAGDIAKVVAACGAARPA